MLSRKCSNNEPKPKHRSLFQHYRSKSEVATLRRDVCFTPERWGNRPAQLVDS